ncbi:MAG: BspA family leucine-rich repeat surface protein, partial [Eggerthellaceae bacterium]|nr:BspA family leucine-rich repeat surface protein [Eggerthellaceae bacterium]
MALVLVTLCAFLAFAAPNLAFAADIESHTQDDAAATVSAQVVDDDEAVVEETNNPLSSDEPAAVSTVQETADEAVVVEGVETPAEGDDVNASATEPIDEQAPESEEPTEEEASDEADDPVESDGVSDTASYDEDLPQGEGIGQDAPSVEQTDSGQDDTSAETIEARSASAEASSFVSGSNEGATTYISNSVAGGDAQSACGTDGTAAATVFGMSAQGVTDEAAPADASAALSDASENETELSTLGADDATAAAAENGTNENETSGASENGTDGVDASDDENGTIAADASGSENGTAGATLSDDENGTEGSNSSDGENGTENETNGSDENGSAENGTAAAANGSATENETASTVAENGTNDATGTDSSAKQNETRGAQSDRAAGMGIASDDGITGLVPMATSGSFSGTGSDVYWSVSGTTLTLTASGTGNWTVVEFGTSLPWKSSYGKSSITRVVIDSRIVPTNFKEWFLGYDQLVSVEIVTNGNVSFNVSGVSSFESMFSGCTNLTTITGTNGWATSATATYTNMFYNCSSLRSLDMTGWSIYETTARGGMFNGLSSIVQLIVPKSVVLDGTGLTVAPSRGTTAGTWSGGSFSGSTQDLVDLYTTATTATTDTTTYNFAYTSYFASNADHNVIWSFDSSTGALTLSVLDASKSTTVTETAAALPWLASVDYKAITTVTVDGSVAKIAPATLEAWFKDYVDLTAFDGSGFDVSSTTSFASLFEGATYLANVNLTGWEMPASSARTYMFAGCSGLARLVLTNKVILANTSLGNTLTKHAASAGSWDVENGVWFGTTDNVVTRYPADTTFDAELGTDPITYVWHANQIGGRFANDNAWWKFADNTLTLGVDDATGTVTVTELAAEQPWLKDASGTTIVTKSKIRYVVATNGIAPINLEDWFYGY